MGCHRFEKTGCWIDPRTEAATPQSVPRSLAWGGRRDDVTGSDMAVKPEVHKTHCIEVKIMFLLFNEISRRPWLQAGRMSRPSDVTPSILFTNTARAPLPPQFSHSRKDN